MPEERTMRRLEVYLEDWQMRVVRDVLGVTCHVWRPAVNGDLNLLYYVRTAEDPAMPRLYLESWQQRQLRDEAARICDFVVLQKSQIGKEFVDEPTPPIIRYGVPTE
jgi:hypothetical protein